MNYYKFTDVVVTLLRRTDDGEWTIAGSYADKAEALRAMVILDLWCEFRSDQVSHYSPWAREAANGGDLNDCDRYYPVLNGSPLKPRKNPNYCIEVTREIDRPTAYLEWMSYEGKSMDARRLASMELAI